MGYQIVHRIGNKGTVIGKAKTKASAERVLMRCNKKHSTGSCVVMTSTGYVDPSFGEVAHDSVKVSHASVRGGRRKVRVTIMVGRTSTGHYTGLACVAARMRGGGPVIPKHRSCGGVGGGVTPTKAIGAALRSLGDTLARLQVR